MYFHVSDLRDSLVSGSTLGPSRDNPHGTIRSRVPHCNLRFRRLSATQLDFWRFFFGQVSTFAPPILGFWIAAL